MQRAILAGVLAWSVLGGVPNAPATGPRLARDTLRPGDWPAPGRDASLARFSPLDQIDQSTVRELRLLWSFETGITGPHEGSPLVVGDRLYVHTPFPNTVHALDLSHPDRPVVWRYTIPEATARLPTASGCCDVGSRGLAYHPSGKLYVPLFPGELAALDAATGREIWRVRNVDPRHGGSMPGAPLVAGDLVIVGSGGSEYGVRGHVTAYDAATGRLVWRAWHTGPDSDLRLAGEANSRYASHRRRDLGLSSWPGDSWRRGGATASGWLAYDPDLDLVFYGTDAPAPRNPGPRPGDNKWSSTLFARSAATGQIRWALQLTPHDEWGYGAANEPILADLTMGGRPVRALVHINANGFAYTVDRASGSLLLVERVGPANWATRIDATTATPVRDPRYAVGESRVSGVCPSAAGAKGLGPAAFSPTAGRFFVPLNNLCMNIRPAATEYEEGRPYLGTTVQLVAGPGGNRGRFVAWDATSGAILWEIREALAVVSGALATAGGLVFYGTMDGMLKAVDQQHGRELWRAAVPSAVLGSPITFLGPDGKQYVAVLSGAGGWLAQGGSGAVPERAGAERTPGVLSVFGR